MSKRLLSIAACAALVLAGCGRAPEGSDLAPAARPVASAPASVAPPLPPPPPLYEGPLVVLQGSSDDLGSEHGHQLSDSINTLYDKYLNVYLGTGARRFLALSAAQLYGTLLPADYRAEVDALASASGIDDREALLAQCFLDISPMTACSTITLPASASPDHVARFGRNLDFPSLQVADKFSTVFVYHPQGRFSFVSVAWPGMIGVLSGMNEHGLALANMEITRKPRLPQAMPYTLLYRSVLEQCRTVNDAVEFLRRTPRQTPNNLMLMDAAGDRAVIELSPEEVVVRRADADAALISTNHRRGTDCDSTGRCWRYDSLHESARAIFGHIDLAALEHMLDAVSQKRLTLQSMVFEPGNRVLYLSTGLGASKGPFYRLDLKPYFESTH